MNLLLGLFQLLLVGGEVLELLELVFVGLGVGGVLLLGLIEVLKLFLKGLLGLSEILEGATFYADLATRFLEGEGHHGATVGQG